MSFEVWGYLSHQLITCGLHVHVNRNSFGGENMSAGLQYLKDGISEQLLTALIMPIIPSMKDIVLAPNQILLQIPA